MGQHINTLLEFCFFTHKTAKLQLSIPHLVDVTSSQSTSAFVASGHVPEFVRKVLTRGKSRSFGGPRVPRATCVQVLTASKWQQIGENCIHQDEGRHSRIARTAVFVRDSAPKTLSDVSTILLTNTRKVKVHHG